MNYVLKPKKSPMNFPRIAPNQASRRGMHMARRGMTLLELTVVILVLLSLITILFFGAQAWKRGSDRTLCVMHIHNVQKGVRSFSNLYGYGPGQSVTGLKARIVGLGKFVEKTPSCPGSDQTLHCVMGVGLIAEGFQQPEVLVVFNPFP